MTQTLPVQCPNCGNPAVEIPVHELELLHSGVTVDCPECGYGVVFVVMSVEEYTMNALKSLQNEVGELYERSFYTAGPSTLMLGVMEEVGELAQAILLTECDDFIPSRHKMEQSQHSVAHEVGDCITYLLALCHKLDIEPYFSWKELESSDRDHTPHCGDKR